MTATGKTRLRTLVFSGAALSSRRTRKDTRKELICFSQEPRRRLDTNRVFLNHWGNPFGKTAFWKRIKRRAWRATFRS
jgi:site-specific recombinase XerD